MLTGNEEKASGFKLKKPALDAQEQQQQKNNAY